MKADEWEDFARTRQRMSLSNGASTADLMSTLIAAKYRLRALQQQEDMAERRRKEAELRARKALGLHRATSVRVSTTDSRAAGQVRVRNLRVHPEGSPAASPSGSHPHASPSPPPRPACACSTPSHRAPLPPSRSPTPMVVQPLVVLVVLVVP